MYGRRLFLIFAILALLSASVFAAQNLPGQEIDPEEGLPSQVQEQIGSYESFSADSFSDALLRLFRDTFSGFDGPLHQGAVNCAIILAAVLLCSLTDFSGNGTISRIVGVLAVFSACTGSLTSLLRLGTDTVESIDRYSTLLLPGLTALSASSGMQSSSAALYLGTVFFLKLLMSLIVKLLMPCVYILAGLAAAEAAMDNGRLKKLRELLRWVCVGTLKLLMFAFTAYFTVTGVITGSADAIKLKAAKMALSGTVPVVGGIVSDASETILMSAVAVKNAAGTYGLLAVLTLCLAPFCRVALQYLLMKGTTALCGLIGQPCHVSLTEHLTDTLGIVTAMVGLYSMMVLISITMFIKIGVPT